MKLTGTSELGVVALLVGLIAFMPKALSFLVSSPVGKAAAFGLVAYLWKQHNELVALLLAVAFVKAAPAYEHATDMKEKDKDVAEAKAKAMAAAKGETM
jgi:predicted outer membrane lipoprotein